MNDFVHIGLINNENIIGQLIDRTDNTLVIKRPVSLSLISRDDRTVFQMHPYSSLSENITFYKSQIIFEAIPYADIIETYVNALNKVSDTTDALDEMDEQEDFLDALASKMKLPKSKLN